MSVIQAPTNARALPDRTGSNARRLAAIGTLLVKAVGTVAVTLITIAWVTFLVRTAIWLVALA